MEKKITDLDILDALTSEETSPIWDEEIRSSAGARKVESIRWLFLESGLLPAEFAYYLIEPAEEERTPFEPLPQIGYD